MTHDLKRTYFILLLPAVAGFILIFVLQHFHLVNFNISQIPPVLYPIVFIASVCFAVAFPIFYRTVFANKRRHQTHTTEEDWLKFELYCPHCPNFAATAFSSGWHDYHGLICGVLLLSFKETHRFRTTYFSSESVT
jgi:hypothetical protein